MTSSITSGSQRLKKPFSTFDVPASMPYKLAFLLACMVAVTDIYVPSLPQMMDDFHSTEQALQLTLTLGCFGFFISSPIIGPIADAVGRRLTLLFCVIFYSLSCMACFFAPNLETVFVCRFLQGVTAAGGPILAITIIADTYHGDRFQQITALIGMVLTFTLSCAPILGGYIGELFGWRYSFLFLGVLVVFAALILYPSLPETLVKKRPLAFKKTFQDYKEMLSSWQIVGYCLLPGMLIGILIAYAGISSYYFIDNLGISQSKYGLLQGAGNLGNALFCLFTARWIIQFGSQRVLKAGMISVFVSAILLMICVIVTPSNPYLLTIPIFIFGAGIAMTFAPATHKAIEPYLDRAGMASSFVSSIRMFISVIITYIAGVCYTGTALSLGLIFAAFAFLTVGLFLSLQSHKASS